MNSFWSLLRALFLLLFMLPGSSFAQQGPVWPREAATGRIVFAGVLPWPTPLPSSQQQQALARRWYTALLTTESSVRFTDETNFAGLPGIAYLDSVFYSPDASNPVDSVYDRVIWRLIYRVKLTATPVGLAYRLSDFEQAEIVFDASGGRDVESLLARYSTELAVFHRRLRKALAGW